MIRTIGLLNHMGGGNLGDDATQKAVIENIKCRWPDSEIALFSMNPFDSRIRHGVIAYPIRTETWERRKGSITNQSSFQGKVRVALERHTTLLKFVRTVFGSAFRGMRGLRSELLFLCRSFATIRSFDLLIVSGGGQLLDAWGGSWKFPFTIFKWVLLARLSGTQCYFLNVGAGPLDHPLGRWFVRNSLRLGQYASFRDDDSKNLVRKIGFRGQCEVVADCVYALDFPAPATRELKDNETPIVGLSPMAYCDPRVYWQKDQSAYDRFVENVILFGRWIGAHNYHLVVFSTDIWFDLPTIGEISSSLRRNNDFTGRQWFHNEQLRDLDQLLSTIRSTDYIITCRFHGVVFAHLLNKPVLALTHHPKVTTLMKDLGMLKYCLDIRNCDVRMMEDAFLSMVAEQDEIRNRMAEKALSYKRSLMAQFDHLFPQRA